VSVITFNQTSTGTKTELKTLVRAEDIYTESSKKYANYNGKKYQIKETGITATDGKTYSAIYVPIPYGARLRGSAAANNTTDRNNLKTIVSQISISSQQGAFDTYINPAFELITTNASTYLSSTKKNVIIVIADGEFDDENYMTQRNNLIKNSAWDQKEDMIYCVGLGSEKQEQYNETKLITMSTNGKFYKATSMKELEQEFEYIYDDATGKKGTNYSESGIIQLDVATRNVLEPTAEYPITVTYMDGTTEKTLFECTSPSQYASYGLTVSGKTIIWNVNTFAATQKVAVPNNVKIKYYIPLE